MHTIDQAAAAAAPWLTELRRDLHKHPEAAWREYRTTAIIEQRLRELGYETYLGEDILQLDKRASVPSPKTLELAWQQAVQKYPGTIPESCREGRTGVMGVLRCGDGPVTALRVDIDALEVSESADTSHRPHREGFASIHNGISHACGHDVHTAIGLGVAQLLAERKDSMRGTVKLLFQPGEEGMRGALPMTAKGLVDDVDSFFGIHVGIKTTVTGQLAVGCHDFLATSKIDAFFEGVSTHAGISPQDGKSALLAAAAACVHLNGIPRHGDGTSRINVGYLSGGGESRNVVPDTALLRLETRGQTTEINRYMEQKAHEIIKGCAAMQDVRVTIRDAGSAEGSHSDPTLMELARRAAQETQGINEIWESTSFGACEDVTYMMNRVRERGGQATFLMLGSALSDRHHASGFDVDEACIPLGVAVLTRCILATLSQ